MGDMESNNNSSEKEKVISYYPQTIASKMQKGLTKEIEIYAEISKALREDGKSRIECRYYMSVDDDFISDVLGCYK